MKNDKADLEGYIRNAIYTYPTLYRSYDHESSRLIVLGHIFLSYGTALEWHPDGFLTYLNYSGKSDDGYKPVESRKKLPKDFFEKELWYMDVLVSRKKEIEADLNGSFFYWNGKSNGRQGEKLIECVFEADDKKSIELKTKYLNPYDENDKYRMEMDKLTDKYVIRPLLAESYYRKSKGYAPYRMCQYSPIVEMINKKTNSPHIENFELTSIRPDWIKGAVDISRYCLAWYKNKNNHKNDYYYPTGKPNEFYERDPKKFRSNCQNPEHGAIFTDEMTIEEYTWASWEYGLNQQIRWFEKLIEMYSDGSEMVDYVHENCPNGIRFRQYAKDKLPKWAYDVRPCSF
jgi:hypothetical protein